MILIFTALKQEATPIISALKLKSQNDIFPIYSNNDYTLIITGVGKYNMATTVGYAFGKFSNIEGAVNIGCAACSSNSYSVGSICIGNIITNEQQDRVYIPDIFYNHNFEESKIISCDKVKKESIGIDNTLYDMEAFAFISACSHFITYDRLSVLKIISDFTDYSNIPTPEEITQLFKSKASEITDFIYNFNNSLIDSNYTKYDLTNVINSISDKYGLTVSQKNILKYNLNNTLIYYNSIPDLSKLPEVAGSGKKNITPAFEKLLLNLKNNIDCIPVPISEKVISSVQQKRFFSHIYIEEQIKDSEFVQSALLHFPNSTPIIIPHYKAVFNRGKQNIVRQSLNKNLIFAKPTGNLVYKGSDYCNAFGYDKFYYCSTVMGCPYNCEYCYLQGLYPTSNIVAFDTSEYFKTLNIIDDGSPALVCCSYDSDITALDSILNTICKWLTFAANKPHITFEIRTKCSSVSPFMNAPIPNVIIAYTLSPNCVAEKYESASPNLKSRLKSAEKLSDLGWRVRICIEPVLTPIININKYFELADNIIESAANHRYEDIVVGSFRINKQYYKKIADNLPLSKLFHNPFSVDFNDAVTYISCKTDSMNIAAYIRNKLNLKVICFDEDRL